MHLALFSGETLLRFHASYLTERVGTLSFIVKKGSMPLGGVSPEEGKQFARDLGLDCDSYILAFRCEGEETLYKSSKTESGLGGR